MVENRDLELSLFNLIFVYMKNEKTYKPTLIIEGYKMKKQLHGGFKIIEYSRFSNETFIRKRVLFKHLTLSEAEDKLYQLESKLK